MTPIETKAIEILTRIALDVPTYRGKMAEFAYSTESLDRFGVETLRLWTTDLAKLVAHEGDELVERTNVALRMACAGDEFAEKEIAGRFMSAVKRLRNIKILAAHPRAGRFYDLIDRYRAGKALTKPQRGLLAKLIEEARAVAA